MKKKRYVSGTVAALAFSLAIGGSVFAAGVGFTDLDGIAGADKITSLQQQKLLKGDSESVFRPQARLTNAEGVQLLANVLVDVPVSKAADDSKNPALTHVKDGAWFAPAFQTVTDHGIVLPADIEPGQAMTREAFTQYLIKTVEQKGNLPMINLVPKNIADESQMTPEYQGAIQRALAWGIADLDSSGNFRPQDQVTRAEAAVMLYNALDFLKTHPSPKAE
ncbi:MULTISPECIES: S-layer homology domain-containing protein [Paenibacillus]|uniref:SLH domain-containing protein n=1 Tax=Paenibacillus albilobatus TaxID=2716884 RepID=A0A920CC54_9BACL|nr:MULTISPECIES: S-layer homology domain-containing protein [Paenibacillus]GIO34316.1 hypothetical protein J2TS6_54570 [Paenibacillus albilobatus]